MLDLPIIEEHSDQIRYACISTAITLFLVVIFLISPLELSNLGRRFAKLMIVFFILITVGFIYNATAPLVAMSGWNEQSEVRNNVFINGAYFVALLVLGWVILKA
jgi:hypothetical protein